MYLLMFWHLIWRVYIRLEFSRFALLFYVIVSLVSLHDKICILPAYHNPDDYRTSPIPG
jgi:hypothetical protein